MKVDQRLEQVSPKWFNTFTNAKSMKSIRGNKPRIIDINNGGYGYNNGPDGSEGNLQDFRSCVVGEACDGLSNYGNCRDCAKHSDAIGSIAGGIRDGRGSRKQQLLKEIKEFCDHYEVIHDPTIGNPITEKQEEHITLLADQIRVK